MTTKWNTDSLAIKRGRMKEQREEYTLSCSLAVRTRNGEPSYGWNLLTRLGLGTAGARRQAFTTEIDYNNDRGEERVAFKKLTAFVL
jgi:hypothetical protein